MKRIEVAATRDLEFAPSDERAGFRLHRLEVFNWGTFHERIWGINPRGDNALLTGDIGSGKSTLVDAITTLLVPPQKVSYNKAAGADKEERSLRTYVLGYFKKERTADGTPKPVALRDYNNYSVILGRFYNEGFQQNVTLAQIFYWKQAGGQPERIYLVADAPLSIAEHFSGFGSEIGALQKRLKKLGDYAETFPPYATALRRRFGIENAQALDLFHQTVSMKSVGSLTEFVRQHMLEPFAVESRIKALIDHFDDLNRAHDAVLKAKAQIERLTPIVADCDRYAEMSTGVGRLRACRDALRAWFAAAKRELLEKRLSNLATDLERVEESIRSLEESQRQSQAKRDDVKAAIAANGGDRIERIKREIGEKERERDARRARADKYGTLTRAADLPVADSAMGFAGNRRQIVTKLEEDERRDAELENDITDASVEMKALRAAHSEIADELESLRTRRSNLPARMLALRQSMCRALDLDEDSLPFAGELIQVREEDRAWEGAAERALRGFGLTLLVADELYGRVAGWVDATHLGDRLVYYRVRDMRASERVSVHERSLVSKLSIKPDSEFYGWLERELARRFDYRCCDTIEQFRREHQAITRAGQIKTGGERHEKDDRGRIDDRSRYVLGWSNEAKISAFEREADRLVQAIQRQGQRLSKLQQTRHELKERIVVLQKLAVFENFADVDWRPLAVEVNSLNEERAKLESESNVLRTLQEQLTGVEKALMEVEEVLKSKNRSLGEINTKQSQAVQQCQECEKVLASIADGMRALFAALDDMRAEALGDRPLTVEACDGREKDMRVWLQERIDAEDKRLGRLRDGIIAAMQKYANDYPLETQDVDVDIAAAREYSMMLDRLCSDDLPRFEQRFKELLNENTIREVANFQSQLNRERQTIVNRIDVINRSLREIDYTPGRYIELEALPETESKIKDFRAELRACTEGALTGSEDETYSEAKFLEVKRIIERFRGREATAEADRKWTREVTDVRNWFTFAASEKWREDNSEHEHYADSDGKSGGQKEKLAYTVLAASLAYQFGLEWGAMRSRTFRFVVIDEAFGRGSDESAQYGLELFKKLNLQLLIVTPLQKIHIIEPYVSGVGFVHNEDGRLSMIRNLTIEEYRAEKAARGR